MIVGLFGRGTFHRAVQYDVVRGDLVVGQVEVVVTVVSAVGYPDVRRNVDMVPYAIDTDHVPRMEHALILLQLPQYEFAFDTLPVQEVLGGLGDTFAYRLLVQERSLDGVFGDLLLVDVLHVLQEQVVYLYLDVELLRGGDLPEDLFDDLVQQGMVLGVHLHDKFVPVPPAHRFPPRYDKDSQTIRC